MEWVLILLLVLSLRECHEQCNETISVHLHTRQSEPAALSLTFFSFQQDASRVKNSGKELSNLSLGEIFRRLDLCRGRNSFDQKVRVHQSVNDRIQQDQGNHPGGLTEDTNPHAESNSGVMVNLQEARFFAF